MSALLARRLSPRAQGALIGAAAAAAAAALTFAWIVTGHDVAAVACAVAAVALLVLGMEGGRDASYTLVHADGGRERLRSWRVHRYGSFPLVLWAVEQTWPPAGVVDRGWSLTRPRALEAAGRSPVMHEEP